MTLREHFEIKRSVGVENVLKAIPLGPGRTDLDRVLYGSSEAEGTWSRGVRCPTTGSSDAVSSDAGFSHALSHKPRYMANSSSKPRPETNQSEPMSRVASTHP